MCHTSSFPLLRELCVCVCVLTVPACVFVTGTSWALDFTWAGQRPVWPYWEDQYCVAPTEGRLVLLGRLALRPVRPQISRSHLLSSNRCRGHTSCRPLQALFLQPEESRPKHLQSSIGFGRRKFQSLCLKCFSW